jgi:putative transcriptional regulator
MQPILLESSSDVSGTDNAGAFLTGKLLAAMPSMSDPRFHKALIFICAHDANGAMGIVINNEMTNIPLSLLLSQLSLPTSDEFEDFPVLQGGPVETARGLLLHSSDVLKTESIRIDRDFAVTGTIEALREIVSGEGPHDKLFALGYAGWSAGQLESEIAGNAWLVIDADPDLVFRTVPGAKWEKAIRKLGVDPALLTASTGHA